MAEQISHLSGWWAVRNKDNDLTVLVVTTSLLIINAILWYKFKFSNSSNNEPPLPPGPRSLPIVGYLPFLTPSLHTQFTNMAQTYGPIFKFYLGSKLHVVINTPELAKEVLRDQDEIFSNRDQTPAVIAASHEGQDVSFSKNGPNWRKLRKIFVHEVLSNKSLRESSSFRREAVRKTIKNVLGKVGTAVDMREVAFTTEANVLTRMMWENTAEDKAKTSEIGSEIDKVNANLIKAFGRVNLSDYFPSLARFDLQGVERAIKAQVKKLDEIFGSIIEDRIQSESKRSHDEEGKKDFIQILLDHRDEKDGKPLTMTQMKALLLDIMVAGTETAATTVEWVMAVIMKDPKLMKKVQEELVQVVGLNNKVEESHLSELKYLDATIKETLRLFPVVPFLIPRAPSKKCTVGGYTIPKGTTMFMNVWSVHRDARHWEDPLEFKPERFLTDNKWDFKGTNSAYFPFGSGRRYCAGLPLAEKMLMYILASLLHSFDWSLPKGEKHDLSEISGIVLQKKKPLVAVPSQRLPDVSLYM